MWEWQINWDVTLKRMSRMRKSPFINVLDELKLHNKNQQEPASSEPATYEGFSRGEEKVATLVPPQPSR